MPRCSIFTPSHNPRWLDECWETLAKQTFSDFEWIVVLNGGARWRAPYDERISVHLSNEKGVGALKSLACAVAEGEFLVELDHDDLLAPNALEAVVDVFDANEDASLVYSDFAQIEEDGSPNFERFAEGHGWTYRAEGEYQVIESKLPTPHNVSYIWYAPNHVRAFRKTLYEQAGGYDIEREIADDADLMCRLYQEGPFVGIPELLYFQRIHPGNTQRDPETNAKIQAETVALYDQWVQPNALKWAERENLACLDLGGAHNCPEGYTPIDIALDGNDIFESLHGYFDDTVGVIRAVDFLEHVADKVALINEIHRVLAPGGMLLSLTPSTDGRGAFCDPTHTAFYNELSFRYYCDEDFAAYVPAITARFRQSRLFTFFPSEWHEANQLSYVCSNLTKE